MGKSKSLKRGDRVSWKTTRGTTRGVIKKKLTAPTSIKKHQVDASPEHPQYLVESEKTGAQAAHTPDALTPIAAKRTT